MNQVEIAEVIARVAHAEQVESLTGDDYIGHVERVVSMVEGDDAKAVAWLHDALEDTCITRAGLKNAGVSSRLIEAVALLTRKPGESYLDVYIPAIKQSGDLLAISVKLADLRDHLRPSCTAQLWARYEKALALLEPSEA